MNRIRIGRPFASPAHFMIASATDCAKAAMSAVRNDSDQPICQATTTSRHVTPTIEPDAGAGLPICVIFPPSPRKPSKRSSANLTEVALNVRDHFRLIIQGLMRVQRGSMTHLGRG